MKNFFTKFKYTILGVLLAVGVPVSAANITVPSAPGAGYDLTSTSTGAYVSTTTNPRYVGSIYASTTNPNYLFGPLLLPNLTQGYSFVGSNGRVSTISTSTLASNLTALCATITGGSGLCDGVDDTSAGGSSLATTSPWTFGNIVTALTNGTVTTISTSTLVNNIFPFTSYGASTSTVFGFTGGLFATASSTFSSALRLTSLSQGLLYVGSTGLVNTTASSSLFGFTPASNATTITVAGTSNQITSSAGAQDLSANRTWTLSFPNQVIFPQYASTTNGFSTPYASSTVLHIGTGQGIAFVGSNGKVGAVATSSFSLSQFTNDLANLSATDSTLTFSGSYNGATARTVGLNLANANTWTAKQNFFGAASSTLLSANWAAFGSTGTTTISTTGLVTMPYSSTTGQSTFEFASSTRWFGGGLNTDCDSDAQSLGWDITTMMFVCGDDDSGIGGGVTTIKEGNSDVTTAATAIDFASGFDVAGAVGESEVTLDLTEYTGYASTTGISSSYASSTQGFFGSLFTPQLSQGWAYVGSNGLIQTSSTSTLANFILPFTSYGASTSTVLGFTSGLFSTASSTFSSAFRLPSLTQGFPYIGSTGLVSTISTSTLASHLFTFTSYGMSTSTIPGFLNGFFSNASSTITTLDVNTELTIPDGGAPVLSKIGSIAYDSTDKQLLIATTTANTPAVIPLIQPIYSRTIASTSVDMVSGGRIGLPYRRDGFIITEIHCWTEGGTSAVINLDTNAGGSNTDTVTCDADAQSDTSMSANYIISAGTLMSLEFGTITGAVDYTHVTVYGFYTRE